MEKMETQPPNDFDAASYDVEWDAEEEQFIVKTAEDVFYTVTPHALAALQDLDYRQACWAVQKYIRQGYN